jgi:hypothetical protein
MIPMAFRAAVALACSFAPLSLAVAQGSAPAQCRQGVLALIVMIEAEEYDRSHYRSTAASVVESCGPPPPAQRASASATFDKPACGKLALTMLEGIEKMASPEFVQTRDAFAAQCRGG